MSPIGQCYLAQMMNPFDFKESPIQSLLPYGRTSKLYTAGAKFTFTTSTTTGGAGYGYVYVNPYQIMCSDLASIICTSSTTTISTIDTVTTNFTTPDVLTSVYSDSPFTSASFSANAREFRIISLGIRIRNISPRDYMG